MPVIISEGFRKNLNCSIDESLKRFEKVATEGVKQGLNIRGYVSCVLGCPYEGKIPSSNVIKVSLNFSLFKKLSSRRFQYITLIFFTLFPFVCFIFSQFKILQVTNRLLEMGCSEISLGDTIGVGTPGSMRRLLDDLLTAVPVDKVAVHCHDTYGQALANVLAAIEVCNLHYKRAD